MRKTSSFLVCLQVVSVWLIPCVCLFPQVTHTWGSAGLRISHDFNNLPFWLIQNVTVFQRLRGFCIKSQLVCQHVFVYTARWIEEEEADIIFIYHTHEWDGRSGNKSRERKFCFCSPRLMARRSAWERPWLGHESGASSEERDFAIGKQILECLLGSRYLNNEALCRYSAWPWEGR